MLHFVLSRLTFWLQERVLLESSSVPGTCNFDTQEITKDRNPKVRGFAWRGSASPAARSLRSAARTCKRKDFGAVVLPWGVMHDANATDLTHT